MRMMNSVLALVLTLATSTAFAASMKVDPAQSTVKWEGSKKVVSGKHNGTIAIKSGTLETKGDQVVGGTIEIDMKSIKNEDLKAKPKDAAKLEGHLKSADFFGVDQHPTATLKITSVKAIAPGANPAGPTHEVTGDLTIKGKTSPVTFPMTVSKDGNKTTATGVVTFDRSKYDVRYGSDTFFDNLGNKAISNDIKLDVKVVATK